MLGRLIKYEWKATYKMFGLLFLFTAVITSLGCASFSTPMWSRLGDSDFSMSPVDIVGIIILVLYIFVLIGIAWGSMIYIGIHFYRSMYSDEGYLTHTLPVTPYQLFNSKLIVSYIWYLLTYVAVIASMILLVYFALSAVFRANEIGMSVSEAFHLMPDNAESEFEASLGMSVTTYIIVMLALILLGSISSIVILFGAITLGQLFAKHKVLMSVVCYFGISMVIEVVVSFISLPMAFHSAMKSVEQGEAPDMVPIYVVSLLVTAIVSVGLYFMSNYIIRKKLNLD